MAPGLYRGVPVFLTLRAAKTDRLDRGQRVTLHCNCGSGARGCPVHMLERRYHERRECDMYVSKHAPLFVLSDGTPLSARVARAYLQRALRAVGVTPDQFTCHSFRIGRASEMRRQRYDDSSIMKAGRWSSSAYKLYLRGFGPEFE